MYHNVGHELLDVPFPAMVFNMANAIAQSQVALDKGSIEIMKIMGNKTLAPVYLPKINVSTNGRLLEDDGSEETDFLTSMIGAGFQPTFYQFVETIIEVKMTIKLTEDTDYTEEKKGRTVTSFGFFSLFRRICVTSTPINSTYTNSYNYSVEGSSLLRTRLVPLPPNTFIQRLLDMKAQSIQAFYEVELKKAELAIEQLQAEERAKADALPPPGSPS
ncbi:MAG: hypothetical protein FWG61_08440 [Firmicutes bacterium]|nr:hypothetical protein [Bacillota bacterium]